jgi:glycosyltransferase involved in cell wall biosynthesis
VKNLDIDVIFNMSSFAIKTDIKQVFLFQWPYAVYPESSVWKMMDIKSYLIRKIKLFMFKKNLKYINTMIAQTDTMKKRLEKLYNIKSIKIVPNAVSIDNIDGGEYKDFKLPNGIKLLYLTYYYPHKNLEIFIPLAKRIKNQNLNFKIVITIDENQHQKAKELLENIKKEKLEDVIINLGSIEMKNIPSLYKQVDGLLMPTLLESFSGTYIEAMYHKIPIFTSNIDFATTVCKDVAFYFDPFNEKDILNKLKIAFNSKNKINEKIEKGYQIVRDMDTWNDTTEKYLKIINDSKGK